MAKSNNLTDFLTDLADGIRKRKRISGKINPQDFRAEIESIEGGGIDTSDATASASDILSGKTAYVNDELVEGTIETYDYSFDEGGDSYTQEDGLIEGTITSYTNDRVTKVDKYVFAYKTNLESVKLALVSYINTSAFNSSKTLNDLYLGYNGVVALAGVNAFSNVGLTQGYINVHVRPEYADQYADATNWSSLIANGTVVIVGDYKEE